MPRSSIRALTCSVTLMYDAASSQVRAESTCWLTSGVSSATMPTAGSAIRASSLRRNGIRSRRRPLFRPCAGRPSSCPLRTATVLASPGAVGRRVQLAATTRMIRLQIRTGATVSISRRLSPSGHCPDVSAGLTVMRRRREGAPSDTHR